MDLPSPLPKQTWEASVIPEVERPGRKENLTEEGKGRLSIDEKLRATGERLVRGRRLAIWGDPLESDSPFLVLGLTQGAYFLPFMASLPGEGKEDNKGHLLSRQNEAGCSVQSWRASWSRGAS